MGISQEYKRGEKVSLFQVLHFFSILRVFHSLFSLPPSFSCILVNFSALTVILLFFCDSGPGADTTRTTSRGVSLFPSGMTEVPKAVRQLNCSLSLFKTPFLRRAAEVCLKLAREESVNGEEKYSQKHQETQKRAKHQKQKQYYIEEHIDA